jgi:hypothetical protein
MNIIKDKDGTINERRVLKLLRRKGSLTKSEICSILHLSLSTAHDTLSRLGDWPYSTSNNVFKHGKKVIGKRTRKGTKREKGRPEFYFYLK